MFSKRVPVVAAAAKFFAGEGLERPCINLGFPCCGIKFKFILSRREWIAYLNKYKGGEEELFTTVAPRFRREN